MPTTSSCILCGSHYSIEDAPLFLWQQEETCEAHRQALIGHVATTSVDAVVPKRQRGARSLLRELASWTPLGDDAQGVYLFGAVGRGKSYQAAALLRSGWAQWMRYHGKAPTIAWYQVAVLLQHLRSSMGTKNGSEWLRVLFDCDLLVLDDLGAERVTDWTREQVLLLISERYDRGAVTILTSNYALGDLAERLTPEDDPANLDGQRIASRIAQSSLRVEVVGDDRRLRRAEN